jgi:hypothetical protein
MSGSRNLTIVACALAIVVAGTVFFISKYSKRESAQQIQTVDLNFATTTIGQDDVSNDRTVPAGMHEYKSTEYNFSLFYPQELTVSPYNEGGGAATITFQNPDTVEGFQIFITPYDETQISDARFKQDEPSGVRESLSNITVDGATGAEFFSTDVNLGATREVWFIHGGFLYEVTTLKSLDSWLADILQTWKFL